MASNKNLKKAIGEIAEELYLESLFYYQYAPEESLEQIEKIIFEINAMQEELLHRTNNVPGKANPKLVKDYYTKLKKDINKSVQKITAELDKLNETLVNDGSNAN